MSREVIIDYTNHRGERRERRIKPLMWNALRFEDNEWHPETQWLLWAYDMERTNWPVRCFAMKNVHSWRPVCKENLTHGSAV